MARSIEVAILRGEPLLFPTKAHPVRAAEVKTASGQAVAENNYCVELYIELKGPERSSHRLRMVVARNDQELAQTLKAEGKNLVALHARMPKHIPMPLAHGLLFLPDRHRRPDQNRRLPAYVTRTVPESHYCGIASADQLRIYSDPPKLLSRRATDAIKARVLEICIRSFDPAARTSMPPPELHRGNLRLSARDNEIIIAGCPYLWEHMDNVGVLHRLTGFDWKEGDRTMPLLPTDVMLFREAMVNALTKATAREWAKDYAAALESGRYKPHHRFPLEALTMIRESLAR